MKSIELRVKSFPGSVFIATLVVLTTIWLILNLTAPRIPIFGFHSIIDIQNLDKSKAQNQELQKMDYAKQDLEQFLDYLIAHNFWFLSSQEMYEYFIANSKKIPPEHIGKRPIMVTFDDSYKTFYANLLPVLESLEKKYGQKAKVVLFINPGTLVNSDKKTSYYLTCGNLSEGL